MRILGKLIGLGLILAGLYFLGQNIIFTTRYAVGWWRDLSAAFSVVALVAGILTVLYGRNSGRNLGWILIILGLTSVFFSGGVFLRPTSLWQFFVGICAIASGFQLLTTGRISL